jgi:hypothetical protein
MNHITPNQPLTGSNQSSKNSNNTSRDGNLIDKGTGKTKDGNTK